jgi:hypothetical protein
VSRRKKYSPPPPGTIDVPTAAVVYTDRGQHSRARLCDLIDGRTIGQGETVLWRGDSPERSWAGGVPVYAFRCRRCGRDVPLRLPTLLAAIDADRREHPGRAGAVVEISTVQEVLE